MTQQIIHFSEQVAEMYATQFLNDYVGGDVFLGGDIEQILADRAVLVYQNVADPSYYGAALHLADQHLIAINTYQNLRVRYYSAAHELWHLLYESGTIAIAAEQLNQERAADHFAAAVMLPVHLIKNVMQDSKTQVEWLIFKIADLSAMPYQAVAQRLHELGYKIPALLKSRTEAEWVCARATIRLVPSVLDKADAFTQFDGLAKEVEKKLSAGKITLELAANVIKHVDGTQAEKYWQQRQAQVADWVNEDD